MRLLYRRRAEDTDVIEIDVTPLEGADDRYRVTVGEQVFELSATLFHRAAFLKEAGQITLQVDGKEYRLFEAAPRRRSAPRGTGDLRAPTAGRVIRVLVQAGESVKAGDPLVILEAMKMEQQIVAPHDGRVARVQCHEGDQVSAGTELVQLTAASAPAC